MSDSLPASLADLQAAGPAVVLVEPQLGENIGTAARAMANFGLGDLRIVKPRDGWPNPRAIAAASRADHVIEKVRVFDSVEAAIADLRVLYASTARPRDMTLPVVGPAAAAEDLWRSAGAGLPGGVLFGRERIGLMNDEIALADRILTLPIDPRFASLNVAQAVLVVAYEWRRAGLAAEQAGLPFKAPEFPPASKGELTGLFAHLEGALDKAGYFRPPEKRPQMVLNLRTMLERAHLTEQDVRTLRGAVAALERRPTRPHLGPDGKPTTIRGEQE